MQCFLGDPEYRKLNLENYHLTLAIAKKTLGENCFRHAQKTTDRTLPSFQLGDRVYFRNKLQQKWDLNGDPDTGLFVLSMTDTICT